MKEITTYGKITSISTSENEDKREIKVKIEGIWELDGAWIEIAMTLKGNPFSIQEMFVDGELTPGKEIKIRAMEGPQASLTQFEEIEEVEA